MIKCKLKFYTFLKFYSSLIQIYKIYRERGITLDLGFSSFSTTCPEHLEKEGYKKVQYTLVDCPGHASLIKTVIGGNFSFIFKFEPQIYSLLNIR